MVCVSTYDVYCIPANGMHINIWCTLYICKWYVYQHMMYTAYLQMVCVSTYDVYCIPANGMCINIWCILYICKWYAYQHMMYTVYLQMVCVSTYDVYCISHSSIMSSSTPQYLLSLPSVKHLYRKQNVSSILCVPTYADFGSQIYNMKIWRFLWKTFLSQVLFFFLHLQRGWTSIKSNVL